MSGHGNARFNQAGGARPNYATRRTPQAMGQECAFAAPPPHRVYCMPAAFHATNGMAYQPLVVAYGHSRPSNQ
jgi:hypothetical protein